LAGTKNNKAPQYFEQLLLNLISNNAGNAARFMRPICRGAAATRAQPFYEMKIYLLGGRGGALARVASAANVPPAPRATNHRRSRRGTFFSLPTI